MDTGEHEQRQIVAVLMAEHGMMKQQLEEIKDLPERMAMLEVKQEDAAKKLDDISNTIKGARVWFMGLIGSILVTVVGVLLTMAFK